MFIRVIKQKTCEGCLPACLLSLIGRNVTLKAELGLLLGGFRKNRENYAIGILHHFVSKYGKQAKVYVHNKYFFKKLRTLVTSSDIDLKHEKINLQLINKLEIPFILYLDDRILRKSIHYPHFVIVERKHKNRFVLIDPWDGRRKWFSEKKLMRAVLSLKNYLNFCPLLITIE